MRVDVVVEIPKGSRNKYEFDEKTGQIKLDRVLKSSVQYPGDYGEIQGTLGEDGDPLDAVIINRFPTFPGCRVPSRILGVLEVIDGGSLDEKIIVVPEGDSDFDAWENIDDISESVKDEIKEFFATYKNLEGEKTVEVKGWSDRESAEKVLKRAKEKYAKEHR